MRLPICLFALCFALCSCHRNNVVGVEIDSKLKGFILPKSQVLAGVELDKIKETDFYHRHQARLALPQLNFSEQLGMDPGKDLSYFLMSWDGTNMLNMAHGNFESAVIEKRLKANSVATEKYSGILLFGDGSYKAALLPTESPSPPSESAEEIP